MGSRFEIKLIKLSENQDIGKQGIKVSKDGRMVSLISRFPGSRQLIA